MIEIKQVRNKPKTGERVRALQDVTKELKQNLENITDQKELSNRKRKSVRRLKHFTAAKPTDSGEDGTARKKRKTPRKNKGWSPKANKFFCELVKEIKQDVASKRLERFEELYRAIDAKREKQAAEENKENSDDEEEHMLNCEEIYELELTPV